MKLVNSDIYKIDNKNISTTLFFDKNKREILPNSRVFNHNTKTFTVVTQDKMAQIRKDFEGRIQVDFLHLEIMIDNKEITMKDADNNSLRVGDKIQYIGDYDDDNSLYENCEKYGFIMKISEIDENSELLWCEECPYAIQASLVRKRL